MSYNRSISQLKSYTGCGERFYLERICRLGPFPAAWTILGIAFHEMYEKTWMDLRGMPEVFTESYDRLVVEFQESQPSEEYWSKPPRKSYQGAIDFYRKRALENDIPNWEDYCSYGGWSPVAVEESFEILLNGVTVRGAIDLISVDDESGTLQLEDVKTGSPKRELDTRQLRFYMWVARENGYNVERARYYFTNLDRGSEWVYPGDHDEDGTEWGLAFESLDELVNNMIFLSNPGDQCGLCPVKPWCSAHGNYVTEDAPVRPKREVEDEITTSED